MAIPLLVTLGSVQANTPDLARLDRLVVQQLEVERATIDLQLEAQQNLADNERLLTLYREEHKALTQSLARQKQQQDEVAEQRRELLAAQVEQEQRTVVYEQQLEQGQQLLSAQWQRLPPPLQASLQDSLGQLQDTGLGLSERFAALIAILTKLEAFNSSISLHQGTLLHQGEPWRAEQLFIGLAQGYYRLPDGGGAGVGHAVDGIWQWQSRPDQQASINRAFAIYQGQQSVEFVDLPLSGVPEVQP